MRPLDLRTYSAPALCLLSFALVGCAGSRPAAPAGGALADTSAPPLDARRPVAIVDGAPLAWTTLAPALSETAGALALEEAILDAALASELARRGLAVAPDAISIERERLASSLAVEAGAASSVESTALIDRLRSTRGLGPARFNALLRRNAALRALVAADAQPTPDQLASEVALQTGRRFAVRLFTAPSPAVVAEVRAEVASHASAAERLDAFAKQARTRSTDASAQRDGLLQGVSPVDPAVPAGVRAVMQTLQPGEVSPIVALPDGFAILMVESAEPAVEQDTPEGRARIEARLRARLERLAMEREAQRILSDADVTVLDPSLAWSWENAPRQRR